MAEKTTTDALDELLEIMATLREPNGCPWDRQQTPQSLKPYILEEAYELLAAIDQGDPREICDELGDLLLQIVFQTQIFSESGTFTMADVAKAISSKLLRRHPHIFASAAYEGHQQRWEKIKLQERSERGQSNKIADRIPVTLPALKRAAKLQKTSAKSTQQITISAIIKQAERIENLQNTGPLNKAELEAGFGQLLFSITGLAQALGIDAEDALRLFTNHKIAEIDNDKTLL